MSSRLFQIGLMMTLAVTFFSENVSAQYDTIPWDGLQRTYLVHLPEGYTGDEPLPLLIAMHGGVGNAFNMESQSEFSVKADESNFIVVYPEGAPSLVNIRTWNAGNCCAYAMNNDIDDVGFINALIDHLISGLAIDENRIYATGMSNGGMMAYRLACELSDRIAAIGPVATTMVVNDCDPIRPVPVIAFHSYLDENVPYEGGYGDGLSDHYNPPQDSVIMVWSQKNECMNLLETVVENDEYTYVRSSDCECLSEVQHYTTTDGGHSWPGGNQTQIGDSASQFLNATAMMWEFFTNYTLECNVIDGVEDVDRNGSFNIYPNPSNGIFKVLVSENNKVISMQLFSPNGDEFEIFSQQNEVDLSQLSQGIYLLKVTTTEGVFFKRLVHLK